MSGGNEEEDPHGRKYGGIMVSCILQKEERTLTSIEKTDVYIYTYVHFYSYHKNYPIDNPWWFVKVGSSYNFVTGKTGKMCVEGILVSRYPKNHLAWNRLQKQILKIRACIFVRWSQKTRTFDCFFSYITTKLKKT